MSTLPELSARKRDWRRVPAALDGRLGARARGVPDRRRGGPRRHGTGGYVQDLSLVRRRATAWLCSWQIRDSLTSRTAAISLKLSSCS